MTRGFCFFFLISLSIQASSEDSLALKTFSEILDDFSPYKPNFDEIHLKIEEEMKNQDPEFLSQYAEFLLLGLPLSSESPINDNKYVKNNKFLRDIDSAVFFFKKTISNSKNSAFFLHFLHSSSFLIEGLDKYLPFSGVTKATLRSLQEKSVFKRSSAGVVHFLNQYQRCLLFEVTPSCLKDSSLNLIYRPSMNHCSFSCEDIAFLAFSAATESMEYRHRSKKEYIEFPAVGKEDVWTVTRLQSTLKMFEKISTVSEDISTLAEYYIQGQRVIGMQPDIEFGLSLLEKSAESGNVKAHEELGNLYMSGRSVSKNMTKAIYHLKSAKSKGSPSAQSLLGKIYLYGSEVPADEELGLKLLQDSLKQGDHSSYAILGEYHFLKKNWAEAYKYLPVSASLGHEASQYYYSILLTNNYMIETCDIALDHFKELTLKSSLRKYAENAYMMYNNGDLEGAFLNFLVSASLGEDYSNLALAYMFENNQVPHKFRCKKGKEFCAAWFYFFSSKTSRSLLKLGKIIAKGNEFFKGNYSEAKTFFLQSEALPESLYELAKMHEFGLGVDMNLTKAEDFLNLIIERAEKNSVDKDAKYPAYLALFRIWVKKSSFSDFLAVVGEFFWKHLNDLAGYLML
jgi:TPR repeat protein